MTVRAPSMVSAPAGSTCRPVEFVIWLGSPDAAEFREAHDWLASVADVRRADRPAEAIALIQNSPAPPFAVVIAQTRPGQWSSTGIEAIHRATPLCRLIAVNGVWCDGEQRTGSPLPGVVRVPWHRFRARLTRELARQTCLAFPRTASETERLMTAADRPEQPSAGLIVIRSCARDSFAALADVCAERGFGCVWRSPRTMPRVTGARAGIWDCQTSLADEIEELSRFAAELAPAPVVVLAGFLRPADREWARSAGAAELLDKPFENFELLVALDRIPPAQ